MKARKKNLPARTPVGKKRQEIWVGTMASALNAHLTRATTMLRQNRNESVNYYSNFGGK